MTKVVKVVKKVARKVRGAAIKRYFKKGYNPKINQIVKDVAMLRGMVNSEKKRNTIATGGQVVAQLNGATGQGLFITDITPTPSEGTTSTSRTGNSIKLHSSFQRFQFYHQSATTQPINFQILILQVKGPPVSNLTTFVNNIYTLNPFVSNAGAPAIVDYNSSFNPDFFGQYRILRRKKFRLSPDQFTGQQMIKNVNLPMKYNRGKGHHIRYALDNNTVPSDGQILMIVLADSGNMSSTTASTLSNVPVSAINTGLIMDYNIVHYFYDN